MKTELKDVSPTQKEIHIEIPADKVRETYNKVSQKYAKNVTIPGFRKGFAPVDVVKLRYQEEIKSEVFRELIPNQVSAAITENGVNPIGEPDLHVDDIENVKVNGSQPINLHVHVEVMPEIAAPNYKALEATRRVRPVNDDEVERVINHRLQENATLVPVEDRKSKEGDTLIVDIEGTFVDKPEEEPIKADDLELTLGEEHIEKAFSENLVDLGEDEEKEFTVEYPADYTSEFLAGQKVHYKAKVKSIGVIETPEANDEWAKSLEEEFKSMKDLRKKLREDLELMAKNDADNKVRDELLTKLIENHQIEVPATLVNIQARNLVENFAQDLGQQGMDLNKLDQNFIKMAFEQFKGQAERDVRGALLLDEVAKLEGVDVSPEEVTEEIEKMATYYRVTPEEVRASLARQGGDANVADRLRSRKAVEILLDNAKITDGEWIDEAKLKAEAAAAQAETEVAADEAETEEKPKAKAKKARKKSE